ncbi:hypothetical protein [Polaromonas sp. A23]|uniref:hypothetical protein n=1 Tax=Polaromonas sp. A23 TaxID=1944133 RepID=UPI00098761F4|nr:hypothetical protein [Polaromonas sp. A23]OOG35867.1 hypothetical protein B0B52_21365 [Polaromonas sp. A23]
MRYLIALVFCLLLVPPQVHACLGASLSHKLFFETIPNPQPDADVIAKVSLSDVSVLDRYLGTATATVMQVLRTSDARVQQGAKIAVKYEFTSCGPYPENGAEGTIIARAGADSKGLLELYPYMRRDADDHITPPFMFKSLLCDKLKEQTARFCALNQ